MSVNIEARLQRIEQLIIQSSKEVLTLDECSDFTGLSKSHLYKLTSTNQIPHYKPQGKKVYFDKKELVTWLKSRRVATNKELETEAANYLIKKNKKGLNNEQ